MKVWKIVFRVKGPANGDLFPEGLRKDIAFIGKLERYYAIDLFGMRLLGFEFSHDSENFNHICRMIRMLEVRYSINIFEFSEKKSSYGTDDLMVKVDSRPVLKVA